MGTALMVLPQCCGWQMVQRPLNRQSLEQKWSGSWFDCPVCKSSQLIPSRELESLLDGQLTLI